jgi:hypothetical protein
MSYISSEDKMLANVRIPTNEKPMLRRQASLAADAPVTFPLQIGSNDLPIKQVGASIRPLHPSW